MKSILGILKKVAIVVVVVIALAAIFGGGESSNKVSTDTGSDKGKVSAEANESASNSTEEAASTEAPKEKYTITEEELDTSNPYNVVVRGILTNNTDRDYSYLQVEYILYDADGNQVGSALANVNNLKAGGSWKFEASSLKGADEVAGYELADVTGF